MLRCLCCTAGGAVFCSFATPNLSFWSLMPLPTAQSQATGKPRKLPTADNHHKLNRSKYYVTFVTNEGDTPRIVDSLFGAAWADPRRGSVPVAWAIGTPHVHTLAYSHTHIHTSYVHQSRTTSELLVAVQRTDSPAAAESHPPVRSLHLPCNAHTATICQEPLTQSYRRLRWVYCHALCCADPVLGDQFPALWDYYASTAAANDSFVAGVGGGGYVFLNTLSPDQFQRYAQRVGRLLHDYGPGVVDTYGFADPDLLLNYSAEAAKGGVAPSAYISEPTHWGFW